MIDLLDILDRQNVHYKRHGEHKNIRDGWIGLDCPQCGTGTEKYHLGINLSHYYASCWQCGYQDLSQVISAVSGKPIASIRSVLKELVPSKKLGRSVGKYTPPTGRNRLHPAHIKYLEGRGFDPAILVSLWEIEGIGIHHRLPWCIFIPIHQHNKIASWTTRSISDEIPSKYISARPAEESRPIKSLLYGQDHARHAVVVVEGPMDVWKIGPGAVATLGVQVTSEQMKTLKDFPIRVVCFDREKEAQKRAKALCEELSLFPGETYRIKPLNGDPGEASAEEVAAIREEWLQ
jgi:hypothetical protein